MFATLVREAGLEVDCRLLLLAGLPVVAHIQVLLVEGSSMEVLQLEEVGIQVVQVEVRIPIEEELRIQVVQEAFEQVVLKEEVEVHKPSDLDHSQVLEVHWVEAASMVSSTF